MTINQLGLRSATDEILLVCSLAGVSPDTRYIIKNVSGLDVGDITPISFVSGFLPSTIFDMNLGPRTIVLKIELNPNRAVNETFQQLRDNIYRGIASSRFPMVSFDLLDGDDIHSSIKGFITRVEASYFTSTPELMITINCPDPMFVAPDPVAIDFSGFDSGVIEFDMVEGNAPTGFDLVVEMTYPHLYFGLSSPGSTWYFVLMHEFLVGDVLHIESTKGASAVYIIRAGSRIDLGTKISAQSVWPIAHPGSNWYQVLPEGGLYTIESLEYTPKYWGV